MSEFVKIARNGQWSLEKAYNPKALREVANIPDSNPPTKEKVADVKASKDAMLRAKYNMPSKEEHEARLAAQRNKEVPKDTKPDYSLHANKEYKEKFHSATREVSPGKFIYQGTAKKPSPDVSLPKSKRKEFVRRSFERSPVRMSPQVKKR